jgi:large subunit ribosomal protein L24
VIRRKLAQGSGKVTAMKIRRNDEVMVISGDDKGKKGRVLAVFPDKSRVLVEGINFVKRHTRPRTGRQGGIVEKEAPIHVSNVMAIDPSSGEPTRISKQVLGDGKRQRVAKKSGEAFPQGGK